MTKQEFIQEAALRMISARPDALMCEIHDLAVSLANCVYGREETEPHSDQARPAPAVSDLSKEPIDNLFTEVVKAEQERVEDKKLHWGGYFQAGGINVRVRNTLRALDVCTVGDLLKHGRIWFAKQRTIGPVCVETVDKALLNLYGIKKW